MNDHKSIDHNNRQTGRPPIAINYIAMDGLSSNLVLCRFAFYGMLAESSEWFQVEGAVFTGS